MRLLATPNSPYSRIVRVCALELGVDVEVTFVGVRDQADEILLLNPAAKVPTLVTDEGHVLADTRIICETLESLSGKAFLAPIDNVERRAQEGIATGFLDGVAVWTREMRRESAEQSASVIERERTRAERCLEYFDCNWIVQNQSVDFVNATLVSALELMSPRCSRTGGEVRQIIVLGCCDDAV